MLRRPCYGALARSRSESRSARPGCLVALRCNPDSGVACSAGGGVCPADAVAVEGAIVRIVDEACTRCGLCLPACPHDAIEALGDVPRALELALAGRAALILSVECAVHFYPATPNQVVNACYAAGFRTVHRGVLGDELVAEEYLALWADGDWGTMIRSTCPVIVETVRTQYPELIPYLAPVATPIAAEARYLKQLYGAGTPVVYAGVCLTEGGPDVDAAITFAELADMFRRRGIVGATEPTRARTPVVEEAVARGVQVAESFPISQNGHRPQAEAVDAILREVGLAPNGKPWDCGACGYATCRMFANAAALGRTTLRSCPPYLDKQARQAQLQAAIDGLTGLATYRVLRDRLATEVARSDRTGDPFAVLFVDLDNFKKVNDEFGHEAGNEVLRGAARECGAHIRTTDLAARYGGDEFVLVLVRTRVEGALGVADKVRATVEGMGRTLGYAEGLVTASVGVAEFVPGRGPETEDVLVAADRALYRAKASGRNQVATGER